MNRLSVLILSSVLTLSAAPVSAQVASERGPSITVRGDGRAEAPPDLARLSADVVTRGQTPEAASTAHRERATRAATLLRGMTKDGIQIVQSGFRLDQVPVTAPQTSGRPELEYRAVTSFELKSKKLETIDSAVTEIAITGLFEIRNLRFGLDEKSEVLNVARRNAVADARERARIYAEAAGISLGEIIEISDVEPRHFREITAPMAAARSMQVSPPETIALTASVTMTWRIKP